MKNVTVYSTRGSIWRRLSRREFLKVSMAAAGTLALPALASCQPPVDVTIPATLTATPVPEPFANLKEIRSDPATRTLKTSLLVKLKPTSLPIPGTEKPPLVRMYGSPTAGLTHPPRPDHDEDWDFALPGPTWRINAGDRIQLMLYNRLDGDDLLGVCEPAFYPTPTPTPAGTPLPTPDPGQTPTPTAFPDQYPDCFHENNATNIHFHGLHVDQGPHADYVFLTLYPKDQKNPPATDECIQVGDYSYDFQVPLTHPQGTFWYHPHKHGSVALQVANGLCGTLIVEDTLKDDPAFNGELQEHVMVFQTIQQTLNFPVIAKSPRFFTVNGVPANSQQLPEIKLKVGEVQRWRIVNATFQDQTDFNLQFAPAAGTMAAEPEVYFMAMDGYFVPEDRWQGGTNKAEWFYSAPGNRTDFLVRGIEEGTFTLEGQPNTSGPAQRQLESTPTPDPGAPTNITTFLQVTVKGKMETPMGVPETLPALGNDQRPITDSEIAGRKKTLAFTVMPGTQQGGATRGNAPKYLIGIDGQPGTQFDPTVVNECMEVDTAEEWTLENYSSPGHPFHIHLNPFYVTEFYDPNDPNGDDVKFNTPKGLWQDVIIVPAVDKNDPKNPGRVVFRHRFPDITGKFVLHCHILGHEDRGFMHIVEVHPKGEICSAPGCGHGH